MTGTRIKNTTVAAVLTLFTALFPVTGKAEAGPGDTGITPLKDPNPVVARVNGEDIKESTVQIVLNQLMPQLAYHSSVSDERYQTLRKKALETVIEDALVYKEAKRQGARVRWWEVGREVNRIREAVGDDQLNRVLRNSNLTMAEFKEDIRMSITVNKVREKKTLEFREKAEETVTEAYMKEYYEKNQKMFKEPIKFRLREILLRADPGGGKKAWDATKKKVEELAKKVRAGEDFAGLARKFSQDEYAAKGGDMGWSHAGSLDTRIEEAARRLKPGEISEPVMTIYGFHLLKLEERSPGGLKNFEELNLKRLKKELQKKEHNMLLSQWKEQLHEAADIEYLDEKILALRKIEEERKKKKETEQ